MQSEIVTFDTKVIETSNQKKAHHFRQDCLACLFQSALMFVFVVKIAKGKNVDPSNRNSGNSEVVSSVNHRDY